MTHPPTTGETVINDIPDEAVSIMLLLCTRSPGQCTTDGPKRNVRRKFMNKLDLYLLKEVQAAGAHQPKHRQTLFRL